MSPQQPPSQGSRLRDAPHQRLEPRRCVTLSLWRHCRGIRPTPLQRPAMDVAYRRSSASGDVAHRRSCAPMLSERAEGSNSSCRSARDTSAPTVPDLGPEDALPKTTRDPEAAPTPPQPLLPPPFALATGAARAPGGSLSGPPRMQRLASWKDDLRQSVRWHEKDLEENHSHQMIAEQPQQYHQGSHPPSHQLQRQQIISTSKLMAVVLTLHSVIPTLGLVSNLKLNKSKTF